MIKVNNLDVLYGKMQALWDVSFHVEEGEIVALVGANAAGKSTILNTISGLVRPKSGTIDFFGQEISGLQPHHIVEAGISQIPEGRKLFPSMSVRENMELGAYIKRAWDKRDETIEEIFQIFPILREKMKQPAGTLSGGQQQMVAIARGMMARPKLCMFDEPSHGLAPIMVSELFDIIKRLHEHGTTILLVEQNVERTLEVADRAYVLENGRVVLEGKGEELVENEHVREAYLGL